MSSRLQEVAQNALSSIAAAQTQDADDFVSAVTRVFRSRSSTRPAARSTRRRGRKRKSTWNVSVFLLRRANADFLPSKEESAYLSQNGLGMSINNITVNRGSPLEQLEDIIITQYPRVSLAMTGITFARADKGRRLAHFVGSSVDELEAFIGKGKIIVIPKRDLSMPSLPPEQEMNNADQRVDMGIATGQWIDAGTPTVSFRQRGTSASTTTARASATQMHSLQTLTNSSVDGTHLPASLFVNHSQTATDLRHAHASLTEIQSLSASTFSHTTQVVSSTDALLTATPSTRTTTASDGNINHLRTVVHESEFDISVSDTVTPSSGINSSAASFANHTVLVDVNVDSLLSSVQHSALSSSTTASDVAATGAVAETLSTVTLTPTTATTLMPSTVDHSDDRPEETNSRRQVPESLEQTGFHNETFSAEMESELQEAFATVSNTLIDGDIRIVRIHRDRALDEVLQLYHDDTELPLRRVKVEFVGEVGDDLGGLTKDLYTLLWVQILQRYFCGESAVVPHLPLYKHAELRHNFRAIGRILAHTVAMLKIVPARLSRCFLLCLSLGPSQITDDLLLSDFRMFMTDSDRSLVDKALADISNLSVAQRDRLLSFFGTFRMFCNPHPGNIRQLILTIARQQLIDLPAPFVDDMKLGIPSVHVDLFWSQLTLPAIEYIFTQQLPTPARVSSILTPQDEDLWQDQLNALYYLQQFVAALDPEELASFLHFVTGSTVMPSTIWVSFNSLCGELRRPIAHTCSNMVELSCTYGSVQELKREFMAILHDPRSFEMDML